MVSECEGNCFMTKAEESGMRSRLLDNSVSGKAGNDMPPASPTGALRPSCVTRVRHDTALARSRQAARLLDSHAGKQEHRQILSMYIVEIHLRRRALPDSSSLTEVEDGGTGRMGPYSSPKHPVCSSGTKLSSLLDSIKHSKMHMKSRYTVLSLPPGKRSTHSDSAQQRRCADKNTSRSAASSTFCAMLLLPAARQHPLPAATSPTR